MEGQGQRLNWQSSRHRQTRALSKTQLPNRIEHRRMRRPDDVNSKARARGNLNTYTFDARKRQRTTIERTCKRLSSLATHAGPHNRSVRRVVHTFLCHLWRQACIRAPSFQVCVRYDDDPDTKSHSPNISIDSAATWQCHTLFSVFYHP